MDPSSLANYLTTTLEAAAAAGRRRERRIVRVIDPANPTRVEVDGQRAIAFASNDYLGLSGDRRLRRAMAAAADNHGVGAGASHLISGHGPEHHALEEELADFTGCQAALVFSTGYMANLAIGSALLGRGDLIVEDRLNHASLLDAGLTSGARLARYTHGDAEAAALRLATSRANRRLLATDGVFSMDGDVAPLRELAAACRRHDAWLAVDDAHGFGVLGPSGRGAVEAAGLAPADVPVIMATFGKALGSFGAFIAGSRALIDVLVQRARTYIYTTALPPPVVAATRASLSIIRAESWRREHLNDLVTRFRAGAVELGLPLLPSPTAIQPIVLGSEKRVLDAGASLLAQGLLVPAIRPPTVPEHGSRLRVTLSAAHTSADVDRLLEALQAPAGRARTTS
jgi:8-amino-7-oxononanoate synthase